MKKILLINPPRYEIVPDYFDKGMKEFMLSAFFPAGLLRAGTYFRRQGCKVSMINAAGTIRYGKAAAHTLVGKRRVGNFKGRPIYNPLYYIGMPLKEFKKRLQMHERPDEVYITSFFTYHWESVHEVIRICKEVFPSAKVVMGGIYPSLCPQHAGTSLADVIHVGELNSVNNCYLALDLLDEIPDFIVLKTSRGCPGKCSYCAVHLLEGNTMRYRDPKDTVDEIEEKCRKYNIGKVEFWESNILLNMEQHFERILGLIISRKLKLTLFFPEGFNPCLLNENLIFKMRMAGVELISLSVETQDKQTALRRFHSVYKLPALMKGMGAIRRAGMRSFSFVMAGMPEQPVEEVRKTTIEILKMDSRPRLMPFTPIPGTQEYVKYYKDIAHKGLENLHPWLWPCVKSREDYIQLIELEKKLLRLLSLE
jgi:radical SAM superfamily enzyme YgiQ (UPF0313 family)